MLDEIVEVLSKEYNIEYGDNLNLDVEVFDNEYFKDIPGYEDKYQISNYGRVWSIINQKFLKPQKLNKYGYLIVNLGRNNTKLISRLVLESFIGPCPLDMECNHKDDDKSNNKLDNLEWNYHDINCITRDRNNKTAKGNFLPQTILNKEIVINIRKLSIDGYTDTQISNMLDINRGTIYDIVNYRTWKHID